MYIIWGKLFSSFGVVRMRLRSKYPFLLSGSNIQFPTFPNGFQINNVSKWKFYHSRPGSKWKWWPAVNIKHSRSPSWTGSRGDIWVRPNWCKSQHHRHRHRHHRPHHYHHRHRHPLHPVICHHCHPRHPFRSKPQVTHASSKDTAHDSQ